jgi:putative phage-type endonuclease
VSRFIDRVINVEQGSEEWKAARVGRVTASKIKDILSKGKGGAESAGRRDYRMQLACEILTGVPQEDAFYSKEMAWGNEQEKYARAAYQVSEGVSVDQVGMVLHPATDRAAASPDGIVGWDGENAPSGLLEIKCPKTATHVGYIQAGGVPADYQPQMLWQLACTEARWVDFVSFDPRLPENLQLYVCRFEPKPEQVKEVEREVEKFLDEVECLVSTLRRIGQEDPEQVA